MGAAVSIYELDPKLSEIKTNELHNEIENENEDELDPELSEIKTNEIHNGIENENQASVDIDIKEATNSMDSFHASTLTEHWTDNLVLNDKLDINESELLNTWFIGQIVEMNEKQFKIHYYFAGNNKHVLDEWVDKKSERLASLQNDINININNCCFIYCFIIPAINLLNIPLLFYWIFIVHQIYCYCPFIMYHLQLTIMTIMKTSYGSTMKIKISMKASQYIIELLLKCQSLIHKTMQYFGVKYQHIFGLGWYFIQCINQKNYICTLYRTDHFDFKSTFYIKWDFYIHKECQKYPYYLCNIYLLLTFAKEQLSYILCVMMIFGQYSMVIPLTEYY